MSIQTTTYGKEIIRVALGYAKGWREANCKEDDVSCYKYLFENDYNKVIGNAWCTFFGTKVINQAGDNVGVNCPIAFQGSSTAVRDKAKALGIRVDRTPTIGSMFYYPRTGGGHLGVVVWMNEVGIFTVEGNTSDQLQCVGCPKNSVVPVGSNSNRTYAAMKAKNTEFIHIEEYGNTSRVWVDNSFKMPVSSGQQKEGTLNAGMSTLESILLLASIGGVIYNVAKK